MDTTKNVTIGAGHNSTIYRQRGGELSGYSFIDLCSNQQVSASDINAAYDTVNGAKKGALSHKYEPLTSIRLAPGESQRLLKADVLQKEREWLGRGRFTKAEWNNLTEGAQMGLVELAFRPGNGGANKKYAPEISLIKQGNYKDAADSIRKRAGAIASSDPHEAGRLRQAADWISQ